MKGVGWVSQEKIEGIVAQKRNLTSSRKQKTSFHQITFYFTALAQKVGNTVSADPVL